MCGIVGFIGKENAVEITIGGLEKLEYRGYDSAGIAYQTNQCLTVCKEKGRVSALKNKLVDAKSSIAIGHTRWATQDRKSTRLNSSHP